MRRQGFRAVSFNIHHGEGRDGKIDLERTATFIRSLRPDLLALQEVDVRIERSGGADQAGELAALLDMDVRFAPAIAMGEGEYGIAIAARGDQLRCVREPLPRVGAEEPRIALAARWRGISVVTSHLSRNARARVRQTEALAALVTRMGPPALVIGDLNQPARDLRALREAGLRTPRVRKPLRWWFGRGFQIDHVLAGRELAFVRARLVATDVSDHPALVVDVEQR